MAKKNNLKTFKYIEKYLDTDGISGFEHEIAEVYRKDAKKQGAKIDRDGFGSVIAKVGTKGPKTYDSIAYGWNWFCSTHDWKKWYAKNFSSRWSLSAYYSSNES